jgi:outer membrane protein assembly factor BamB
MSAKKVLDLAEKQGLFDAKATAELRRKVAESKFVVTPEAIAKLLVDHGHLTPFQARKLVAAALGPQPADEPSSPGADDDEEIVMLDPVLPPETKEPPKKSPPVDSLLLAPLDDLDELPPLDEEMEPVQKPVQKPVQPSKPAKPSKPRKPAPSSAEIAAVDLGDGLSPLDDLLSPSAGGLDPLDGLEPLGGVGDVLGGAAADPFAQAATQPDAAPAPKKKGRLNQWDSPLLLIGGGGLGVLLLAFVLLFYALTRGSAGELFTKAEEDYRGGSYTSAMATYESFLKKYPKNPQAGLAKVRYGMSQIRQITDGGKDPRQGLKIAQKVLPTIEGEPEFDEARMELVSILPDITDAFATQAKATENTAKREELVKLAEESLTLVNNPTYLPSSRRKEAENRIVVALDKLKAARRSIDEDKELAATLEKITAALAANKTAEAYQLRDALLRTYPGLEKNPAIVKATLDASAKERALIAVKKEAVAAATVDSPPTSTRILLASRAGAPASAPNGSVAFVLLEGSVYGIEVKSGKVLWRRYVSFESQLPPRSIPGDNGPDALLVDSSKHELLRLQGTTGKLIWKQPLDSALLLPVVAGDKIFINRPAAKGQILEFDAASGQFTAQATLPQQTPAPVAYDAKRKRLYQVGEHSTLFGLNAATLACEETFYVGHKAGSILVPPVAVLDTILLPESPSDDYTLIHVLAPRGEKKLLKEVVKPFRLSGRIVLPLSVTGRRVVAVTDLGQIAVYEVDSTNPDKPILSIGSFAATEKSPLHSYYIAAGSELWVAGRRATKYEIQSSLQQLTRRWSLHQDDAFLAPLQVFGDVLVHVRRRPGSQAAIVEACRTSEGKSIWTTQLAAPLVALSASEEREQLIAITSQARVFEIPRAAIGAGYFDQPTYVPLVGQTPTELTTALDFGNGRLLCTGFQASGPALLYEGMAEGTRARPVAFAAAEGVASAPPVVFKQGVLAPLSSGRVVLLDPLKGTSLLLPFQPQLSAGASLDWRRPAVLPPDGTAFVIGDGRQNLFRVTARDNPQPHLEATSEAPAGGELAAPLAAAGDTVYAVVRGDKSDKIVAFSSADLSSGMSWPLAGRCKIGPDAVGGAVFIGAEPDGLLCFGGGQTLRWKSPLKHGPLAGPPVLCDGDFIALYQNGVVARLAADTGEEVVTIDVGEPLGKAAFVMGPRVLVGGYDGLLHIIPIPKKS